MPPCNSGNELVLLASVTAVAISEGQSADDLNILAAFITALGDNLALIAAAKQSGAGTSPQ